MSTPGPMNPLQIQLFAGAAAGRRARFDRSPITFGRDASNLLVVEDATVSRRHGEVRFEGGMWVLANLSENGTRVNRKNATDKPVPLKSGDEVYVGGKLLFNVTIEPVEAAAAGDLPLNAEQGQPGGAGGPGSSGGPGGAAGPVPGSKKKNKLWIGIGIYMGAMLLLVIFLSTLGKKGQKAEDTVPEMTQAEIAAIIRKLPKKEPASEIRYREAISEAGRLFSRREALAGGAYETYRKYQEALSYGERDDGGFPNEDADALLKYRQVQEELIEQVSRTYADACNRLDRGDNDGAYRGFDRVKNLFRDVNSPLIRNVQEKQNIAAKRLGTKKIKKK